MNHPTHEPPAGLVNPLATGCLCVACEVLRCELGDDRMLTALYGARLLQRGWAGRTSPAEAAYIRSHASWARAAAQVLQTRAKPPDGTAAPSPHDPAATSLAGAA